MPNEVIFLNNFTADFTCGCCSCSKCAM